jgi:spore coat protein U-like protein
MLNFIRTTIVVSLLLATLRMHASAASLRVQVSATVTADCRIAVTDLSFGQYDPLGRNAGRELDAAAGVSMTCTREARATIILDSSRAMAGGEQRVTYQIYRDAERTQVWGSGPNALRFVSTGGRKAQEFVVYARIPPGQEVVSGTYADVITANVDF